MNGSVDTRANRPSRTAWPDSLLQSITQASPAEAKILLFRSLFRGREDVYPRRFESRKTGRAGYTPVCGNEWVRGICEKPRIKRADCPNRRFLPVTNEVVRWHLSGRDGQGREFVMGIYPMFQDESWFFRAVEFDGENWQEDAGAFLETCRRLEVPVALERSRSGDGGHFDASRLLQRMAPGGGRLAVQHLDHVPEHLNRCWKPETCRQSFRAAFARLQC